MWLTGDATWFAVPGRAEDFKLVDAAPLAGLRDLITTGGRLTVCTQCAKRRELTGADLLPTVRIAGAATFVEECLTPGTQALVY
jgi:predicted peroxiredoxin